ncbi:MAG: methionine adenosyltransferase [Tumebacillaceae bacterium]
MKRRLFTSESVTAGHPDKMCDIIADAILDAYLEQDPTARVSVEVALTSSLVLISGEVTTPAYVDVAKVAREAIKSIGYKAQWGFDADASAVLVHIDEQSADIAQGVDEALEKRAGAMTDAEIEAIGAGDQGLMFGYACTETPELMPLPIALSHRLALRLHQVREDGVLPYLGPDGKTQVTVEYEGDRPVRIDAIVVSAQHLAEVESEQIERDIREHVIRPMVPEELLDERTKYFINPTGRFVIGGPLGDKGLKGRKIVVDTYGGYARHGGGAFSGKDGTKVDRSAAYAARHVAKNIVAAGLADRCEVQIAYAIGVAEPVSISIDTFGTGKMEEESLIDLVREHFDLRPAGIIRALDLNRPIYQQTAAYGHFGRLDVDLPWEDTKKARLLQRPLTL